MSVPHVCPHCQSELKPSADPAARSVRCTQCGSEAASPSCSEELAIIDAEVVTSNAEVVAAGIDYPDETPTGKHDSGHAEDRTWLTKMFQAALDPRSIYWLLSLGGALMVLGGIIWMVSKGVLENPLVVAVLLGSASLGVVVGGWFVTLKTRYKIAGRALTFLGCVAAPLNLWFYQLQDLLVLEQGLWIGGLACVALYVVTVRILRDPLFVYAVEAGITLTAVLLLGSFGLAGHATHLSVLLMALALVSIHALQAFPKQAATFNQGRFGLPLFWCGHAQLAAALGVLLCTQLANWMLDHVGNVFHLPAEGIPLTTTAWLPGLLWLAGTYAYMYSDVAVRKIGVYLYLSSICLVMAAVSLIGFDALGIEGLIFLLAVTGAGVNVLQKFTSPRDQRLTQAMPSLGLVLSLFPPLLGLALHLRSTSVIASELNLAYQTGWNFVVVMFVVAVLNRINAFIYQERDKSFAATYLIFTAGSLILAAAALLRIVGLANWHEQLPWLMLLPIGYVVASGLWRGRSPEQPLRWTAHSMSVVLLAHAAVGALVHDGLRGEQPSHLLLALFLAEVAAFYTAAALIGRRSLHLYFAAMAGCLSAWHVMRLAEVPVDFFATIFAIAGLAALIAGRLLARQDEGVRLTHVGHVVLTTAFGVSLVNCVVHLFDAGFNDGVFTRFDWISLGVFTATATCAAIASPAKSAARTAYKVAACGWVGLAIVSINVVVDLNVWRKLEIFLVATGLLTLGAGYVGRFKEDERQPTNDWTTLGLWVGSIFACLPVLVAVFYRWNTISAFSPVDEVVFLTVTLLLLATGVVWQVKASTIFGGGTLSVYLAVLVVSLVHRPNAGVGLYLAIGGATLFTLGLLLAVYRDRIIRLPRRIAEREGIFRVISWR